MPVLNTFDRYLLREWLQILGLVLAATCGLLVIQVLYDDFTDLRDFGAQAWQYWQYLAVTVPRFLAIVLLLSLLVSLLFVLGKLHRSNEFTIMRAAGVSLHRLMAPIWLAGLFFCGLAWLLNTTVVPWSVAKSRAMRDALEYEQQAKRAMPADLLGAVPSVAFDNTPAGRMWFFNRLSKITHHGYGVSVSELDAQRREVRRHVAAEAWPESKGGWTFVRGRTLTFAAETGELIGSKPFGRIEAPAYQEDPSLMLLIDRRPVDLSIHELRQLITYLEAERSPKVVAYAVRYYSLMADTLGPLIVIAIAIPFAVAGVRVNPAVGVSKSIGLFVLYYVLSNLAASLAAKGFVEPPFAAWLPNIGMAALAVWFFARLR